MRIIAGELKGRILKTGKIEGTRPTYDKVREALFNILGEHVAGTRVLDLYAGFGSLGIEALSRGAVYAAFVEKNRRTADVIARNLEEFSLQDRARIYALDVFRGVEKLSRDGEKFNIIFADAPYVKHKDPDSPAVSPNQNLLQIVDNSDILEKQGLMIIEHFKRDKFEFFGRKLSFQREKEYGDTCISIYKYDK